MTKETMTNNAELAEIKGGIVMEQWMIDSWKKEELAWKKREAELLRVVREMEKALESAKPHIDVICQWATVGPTQADETQNKIESALSLAREVKG